MPKPKEPCRADWVAGESMILRRTMLEQIGLLDEGLYTYFDDPDICLRARRAGWETWYVPASRVIHFGGASTGVTTGGEVAAPPLLVPGPPAVLLEESWALVHGAGRCGIHPRVCDLAAAAVDSAEAGHRPALHAHRLDPQQCFLYGVQGEGGREPGDAGGRGTAVTPRNLQAEADRHPCMQNFRIT